MCYLVAKDVNKIGSIAWQTTHGKQLAEFKSGLIKKFGYDRIQFVTISRPSAYGDMNLINLFRHKRNLNRLLKCCKGVIL